MDNEIIIGITGILASYLLVRFIIRKYKSVPDPSEEIINDRKCKVKGQWDE